MWLWVCLAGVLYFFALGALLWVTRHKRKYYTLAKGTVSFLFVGTAFLAYALGVSHLLPGFCLLLAALVLCLAGDILLGAANRTKTLRARPFAGGAISFLLAHACLCLLFYKIVLFQVYDFLFPVFLMSMVYLFGKFNFIRLKKMWLVGYSYAFVVGLMAFKAWQVALFYKNKLPFAFVYFAFGATLLLISDLILLFLYFGTRRRKWMRYANLSTYYTGVFLMALTAYWM